MKVLVAGGAGFIGSDLCDRLLNEGHYVICVDNYYLGTEKNIKHNFSNDNFIFYKKDISNLDEMKKIFEIENVEYVFHLAANSDIQKSSNEPYIEIQNTFLTTFTLLECMRLHDVKKIFFASTSAVYGDKNGIDVDESMLLSPISYYGSAKMGAEALIQSYSYMNDIKALVFRFPNVVGSRLTHGVIFDFINKLKKNPNELEILGNGEQKKPYLLASELTSAIIRYMDHNERVLLFNIGVDDYSSVKTIADIVCEEMDLHNVAYHYTGGAGGWKGDVPVFAYGLDKIHNSGWKSRYSSDEAVRIAVRSTLENGEN